MHPVPARPATRAQLVKQTSTTTQERRASFVLLGELALRQQPSASFVQLGRMIMTATGAHRALSVAAELTQPVASLRAPTVRLEELIWILVRAHCAHLALQELLLHRVRRNVRYANPGAAI